MKISFETLTFGFNGKLKGENPYKGREFDETELYKAFGYTLKKLREHKKLSLKSLGEIIDMPPQTINRYENGTNIPTIIQALKIADFFNLSIELFILMGLIAIEENIDFLPLYNQIDEAMKIAKSRK
jgi:transcriptional regulator with XRE-family HTH domain